MACVLTLTVTMSPAIPQAALPSPQPVAAGPEAELVAGFLASVKGHISKPGDEQRFRAEARVLLGELGGVAARSSTELALRREIVARARSALIAGLAKELGSQGAESAAKAFVDSAAKEARQTRIDALERGIMCWCPEENWTLTLTGCARECADTQKALLRQWMDDGSTDEEILARMVSHPNGGPRVLATPRAEGANWVGYLFPGVLAAVALSLLVVALRRMTRSHVAPGGAGSAGSAQSAAVAESDSRLGDQIERELKEMEE